jgi:hypothetical protein
MKKRLETASLVLSVGVLLIAGCHRVSPLPQLEFGLATDQERKIATMMRHHTGRVEVFSGFSNIFSARALYLSKEITETAVDWEAWSRLLSSSQREKLFEEVTSTGKGQLSFLVAFYSQENRKALEKPDSPWKILLELPDGNHVKASSFGLSAEEARLYTRFLQWDLTWANLYLVCFRVSVDVADPDGQGIKLLITGPPGHGSMRIPTRPLEDGPGL